MRIQVFQIIWENFKTGTQLSDVACKYLPIEIKNS